MYALQVLSLALALPLAQAGETVLGLYIFTRYGDRTAVSTPPTILTELGYVEIYNAGTWFRDEYIANGAAARIWNLQADKVQLSQITASAPFDNVMMSSATAFFQGLYPPVGSQAATAGLRNGSTVTEPLNGYQLVPIQQIPSGTGSDDSAWLQGTGNCQNAINSANNYYNSTDYINTLNATRSFYSGLAAVVTNTYPNASDVSYQNAYSVFDLINVAEIHNSTFPASNLINSNNFYELRTLADQHEYNLAFNASDPIRAIAGATLAAQVVEALNQTINSGGVTNLLNVQIGDYSPFLSFFGLANLTSIPGLGAQFAGIPDYASSMVFELFTDASPSPFPAVSDLKVRFYFHNGSTSNISTPTQYPLFANTTLDLSWTDFASGMGKFSIDNQGSWCSVCGSNTGVCANSTSSHSVSGAVGGVIGTFVTLAVIAALVAAAMLCLGLRCIRRPKKMGPTGVRHEKGAVVT